MGEEEEKRAGGVACGNDWRKIRHAYRNLGDAHVVFGIPLW
jgi:hypothetical protein